MKNITLFFIFIFISNAASATWEEERDGVFSDINKLFAKDRNIEKTLNEKIVEKETQIMELKEQIAVLNKTKIECTKGSDCPNGGTLYECNSGMCKQREVAEMVTLIVTRLKPARLRSDSDGRRVEIIKETGEVQMCQQKYDYPLDVGYASGGKWNDGTITICGGRPNHVSNCFTLKKGGWQSNSEKLQSGRSYHGASVIGNTIWMTGGYALPNGVLASTEIVHLDGRVTPGPALPEPIQGHCQLSYQNTTFIIGGIASGSYTNTVMKFDSNNLNNGPIVEKSMVHARFYHACTIFRSKAHNGRSIAIVAGSNGESESNTAEIWDFTQDGTSWKEIENHPESMAGAKMSTTAKGDNILLTYQKGIYTLAQSGSTYTWIKKSQELSISRTRHLQFTVPASLISC